jgi:hypothetical protein
MNEQIERRLDAESASESRGFVGDGSVVGRGDLPAVLKNGPGSWPTPRVDVVVRPLASVAELLEVADSDDASPS